MMAQNLTNSMKMGQKILNFSFLMYKMGKISFVSQDYYKC